MQILDYYPHIKNDLVRVSKAPPGLSGAEVWQVITQSETGQREYCLRKWPTEYPTRDHLGWIHRVMSHATAQECSFVPQLVQNQDGKTFREENGILWEITDWMPGKANFHHDPNSIRLKNMMECLGRFHRAAAQITLDFHRSKNVESRLNQLKAVLESDLVDQLASRNPSTSFNESHVSLDALEPLRKTFVRSAKMIARSLIASRQNGSLTDHSSSFQGLLPVQPVIRDLWHDHVLFTDNEVTGLIDFGAMQIDTVAFDIARLLGSAVGDNPERWEEAIQYYQAIRPLTDGERELLSWIDQTGILLGSLNWLRWLILEKRVFSNWRLVDERIQHLNQRFCCMKVGNTSFK